MENVQRNPTSKKESVDEEVEKLFKKSNGKINQHEFQNLRAKYGNEELVDKIQKSFIEKYNQVTKKAKKFARLIREKYSNDQYPFHILLEKAYKYKVKHGLSEAEFTEFQRIYENELVGYKSPEIFAPNTNVTKLLGSLSTNLQGFNSKLSDSDYKILQEIIKLHATSKALHAQVVLQSMQYEDCAVEAVTGTYDRNIHNVANHVHPVIAALFIPKIDNLDKHFLHSNIANIVRTRFNNEAFTNVSDIELFWALSKDPNDIVCDNRSTLADLYTRALVQNQVWNAVLSLRNGQYYNSSFREFISTIDVCRLNKQDTPDLVYGRYDGTIIKRLLSVFSYRPTVVATMPIYTLFNTNPYQQNIKPTVTYVPMINLKLPPSLTDSEPVNLKDAVEQQQFFLENGSIVPKHTSLIYSRGVLLFFVDRRANVVNTITTFNPFSMNNLPVAASGFERLNDRDVHFETSFTIRDDVYNLRSVVLSEVNSKSSGSNMVIGSSAAILSHVDVANNRNTLEAILYDPYSVINNSITANVNQGPPAINHTPMNILNVSATNNMPDNRNFMDMARTRGIIFMYQLVTDSTKGNVAY